MSNETTSGPGTWTPSRCRRWVDGDAGPLVSVSVEQHVLHVRAVPRPRSPAGPRDLAARSWDDVLAAVEVPRPGSASASCCGSA